MLPTADDTAGNGRKNDKKTENQNVHRRESQAVYALCGTARASRRPRKKGKNSRPENRALPGNGGRAGPADASALQRKHGHCRLFSKRGIYQNNRPGRPHRRDQPVIADREHENSI